MTHDFKRVNLMPHLSMLDALLDTKLRKAIDTFCEDELYKEDIEIPYQKEEARKDRLRADLTEAKLGIFDEHK